MHPLLWTWKDEHLLLPVVRLAVGKVSAACAWAAAVMGVAAAAEFALLEAGIPMGVLCGLLSHLCMVLLLALLPAVLLWCHIVLLAGRGMRGTRYLLLLCLWFGPLFCVCEVYTLLHGKPLLAQQGLLPLLEIVAVITALSLNWGRMEALSVAQRIRLNALPLLLLFACVTDTPETLLSAAVFKLILFGTAFRPLRQLAQYAPRVVSLPAEA